MRFTPWAAALSLCGAALLSACGGSSSSKSANVRLLNATASISSIDLSVNSKTVNSAVAFATAGSYAGVDTGSTASNVLNSTTGQSVAATTPSLTGGNNYTIIAYGGSGGGTVRTALLGENETAPDTNKAKLLVLNLAPDAGTLDVYVTGSTDTLDGATPLTSGYNLLNSGSFRVRVTGSGNKKDLRLDLPAVNLGSASVNTLALLGSPGGVLVNALTVVQQGAVTNAPNTLARVRAVASFGASAAFQGSVNGVNFLDPNTANVGRSSDYVTIPVGVAKASFAVSGKTFAAPDATVKAGSDYTVMIWGDPAAPQFVWHEDDNRLPTINGNVKMRVVNGLSPQGSSISLSVDLRSVANSVTAGNFFDASEISSSSTAQVTVNQVGVFASIFDKQQNLASNGVYTMFVLGNNSTAQPFLVRER